MFWKSKRRADEWHELYEFLLTDHEWGMNRKFAGAFMDTYGDGAAERLRDVRSRAESAIGDGEIVGVNPLAIMVDAENIALVYEAYIGYMKDLRRGKGVGEPIEKAIWAVLCNRLDIVEQFDRPFARYLEASHEKKMPGLAEEVSK